MLARHTLLTVVLLVTCLNNATCSRDNQPTVVLYASADEHVVRQVIDEFEKQSNIRVLLVGDTEVKKTTGLVERLRAEKHKPQADVFWSSEIFMTIALADEDAFAPFSSESVANWPAQFKDIDSHWYGFAARARVIVFAPDRVPPEVRPKTWMNLTDSRLRDRIVMADPRFGTTGGHLGAMQSWWDRQVMPGYYAAFIEGLADNHVRLLPSGNAGVVEAVASGEADVGLTDTDDVWAAQAQGKNVDLIYAAHSVEQEESGVGTLLIPNTVAIINNAPHPEHAKQLMDFLLSEKVERLLAASLSHNIPLRPGLAQSIDDFTKYTVPNPLNVDFTHAAKARQPAINLAMKWLNPNRPAGDPPATQPQQSP